MVHDNRQSMDTWWEQWLSSHWIKSPGPWKKPSCVSVTQSCLALCNPVDCSLPGFSVHEISQARILEWVAISSSRRSSRPHRDGTCVCYVSCIAGRFFICWAFYFPIGEIKNKKDIRPLNTAFNLLHHSRQHRKLKFIFPYQKDLWIDMHGILRVRCHKLEHGTDLHDFPTLGHFPVWNGSSLKIETPVVVLCWHQI